MQRHDDKDAPIASTASGYNSDNVNETTSNLPIELNDEQCNDQNGSE